MPDTTTLEILCAECGEACTDDHTLHEDGERHLCCDCCYSCDDCREHFTDDELTSVEDCRSVCKSCFDNYSICSDCDCYFHSDSGGENSCGESVCDSCSENYFRCQCCGNIRHNDDYAEDGYCDNCHSNSVIKDYSDDAPHRKLGVGPHYLGVELEVECRGDREDKASSTLEILGDDFIICKSDGSLTNGFEIVTAPASLDEQKQRWKVFFANKPSGLKSHDTTTCGLHVHASRAPLGELTIGKILLFVNCIQNNRFITAIARRDSSRWAAVDPGKKHSDVRKYQPDRYQAVKLQNDATIEFRIFKGTLKPESFFACLEFVAALIEFCKPAKHSIGECIGTKAFFNFVCKERKQYPSLHTLIKGF